MLISMPTGTSTIFGAFQAIWHSFWNRTNSALSHKLVRKENFASESFVTDRRVFICCVAKATSVAAPCSGSKQREINSFTVACIGANGDVIAAGAASPGYDTKNL